MPETLPPLRDIIARHGFRAKHSLGQHFLLDLNLTGRIATLAGDLAGRHVVEIGSGPGGLTRALLATNAAGITAVEIDPRGIAVLEEMAPLAEGRLHIVQGDALKVDVAGLVPAPRQIIANLPYNVGTPLLIGWLRRAADFEQMLLMFQEEVADRIAARPDTGAYGRLSVIAQWTCRADTVLRLPPEAFTPPPKVASSVVRLIPLPEQPAPALFTAMEKVTQQAFGQRRKMLRAALKPMGGEALLAEAGIEGTRRAETLSIAEFDRLARIVAARASEATEG